jgi:hypothetical protein
MEANFCLRAADRQLAWHDPTEPYSYSAHVHTVLPAHSHPKPTRAATGLHRPCHRQASACRAHHHCLIDLRLLADEILWPTDL